MSTTQISIHRALQLIKKHKNRVESSRKLELVALVAGVVQKPTSKAHKNKAEVQQFMQSNHDAFYGSLNIMETLKEKITEANINTKISFQGKEVSIVRLLAIKENLTLRRQRMLYLRSSLSDAKTKAEDSNEKEKSIMNAIEDSSQRASREKQFADFSELQVITYTDSLSPAQFLAKVESEIEELEYEVDTLLSESNLQTLISIDETIVL